jgi:hypothetical protein
MKKLVSIIILLSLSCLAGYGQKVSTDKGFSFQGVARDSDGKALANEEIDIQFIVLDNEDAEVFSEEHNLTTDPYGVFVTTIGSTGSSFKDIDFSSDDFKLKVQIKIGGAWETLNEQDFMSVPYSKYADKANEAKTADYAHSAFFPPGMIVPFAGQRHKIPEGWLFCDGSAYDQSLEKYKALFDVIGFAWGKDGSNFRIPDLRSVFLRGVTYSRADDYKDLDMDNRSRIHNGVGVSNEAGTYQDDRLENHRHWQREDHKTFVQFLNKKGNLIDHEGPRGNINDLPRPQENKTWDVYEDDRHGPETRPKNAYVNYIIKL